MIDGKPLFHGSLKLNNIVVGDREQNIPHVFLTDAYLSNFIGAGRIITRTYETCAKALEVDLGVYHKNESNPYIFLGDQQQKFTELHQSFIQNFAFLAPEQRLFAREVPGYKVDYFAFGTLAYFLLMGAYPEGIFPMPSMCCKNSRYDWDRLIKTTLALDPKARGESLVAHMKNLAKQELREIEPLMQKPIERSPYGQPYQQAKPTSSAPSAMNPSSPSAVNPSSPPPISSYRETSPPPISSYKVTPKIEGASQMQEEAQIALLEQEKKEQELLLHSSFEKNLSNPGRTLAAKPMKKSSATQDSTSEPVIKPSELKKLEFDEDPGAIFRKKNSVAPYRPKELEIGDIEPIRSEMQVIEGGEYERGSNIGARDEKPRHVVRIRSFAIDSYP